jgi:adenylate cyclase
MDYTVIGDMVNLASRLEGLTKLYKQPILISESLYRHVCRDVSCRMIDKVIVKGKTESTNIYTVLREMTPLIEEAWDSHERGIEQYYKRDFIKALVHFRKVQNLLPDDSCSKIFTERCEKYIANPPGQEWTGVTILNRK